MIADIVEFPAACAVQFEERRANYPCVVYLMHENGEAFVLFRTENGVIGFGGVTNGRDVEVHAAGADDAAAPAVGRCTIRAGVEVIVACDASVYGRRITVVGVAIK